MLIIYDVTLTLVIMSEINHLRVELTRLFFMNIVCYELINRVMCYIHIIIRFCHVQLCMNDFPY